MALKILILFLINFAMANSFALISIRNLKEDQLVDKIIKVLNNEKNVKRMSHIDVRSSRKDLHSAHNKFERMRIINSKVPYGHIDVNLETENEPIYKTLMRIRKKKSPIFIKDNDKFKIQDNIARAGFSFSFSYPNSSASSKENDSPYNWQQWLPFAKLPASNKENNSPYNWQQWLPFSKPPAPSNSIRIHWGSSNVSLATFWEKMKDLKNKVLENGWSFKTKGKKGNKRSKKQSLRQRIFNKENIHKRGWLKFRSGSRSGEEHDPLAPGKVPFNVELHEQTTVKTDTWLPSYPYWNYWTYEKTLYQDACKGKTVKVGDWCIRPPPH